MDTATSMPVVPSTEETAQLRTLVPLHTLPDDVLNKLLEGAVIETVAKGNLLFKQGDTDHENVYLLAGSVQLLSADAVVETVSAGTDTARFPLAHQLPRKYTARAKSKLRVARLDSRRISDNLARTRTVDYQVADLEDASEGDWMSMLLQSRVLQQVPASNIQRVMMNVEQVEVEKGEALIRQGDPGDFYYMLTSGRAVVCRDNGDGKGAIELATLGPGDAFGEEALLSDKPRNSSVTMLQDGQVLRLGKEQFVELIHNPLLDRIDRAAAQAKVDQGALWLDLRSSDQYDEFHLPGAINFPFESLRYQAASLAPDRHYVLYSNTGGRAMAGAFLLTERGFDVSVLNGGIDAERADPAAGAVALSPASAGDDDAAEARIREAEQRARELEERLQAIQRAQDEDAAERQQHLQHVRLAVDQARRKVLETELQKREALEERQKAYAEMERLTSNLEAIENERASLVDRMSEIEGLDKQLQNRLAKAERELVGERERAESSSQALEDLSQRLTETIEQREQERQRHALERGELKEALTELQMEFEQAKLDLEDAQRAAAHSADHDALEQARARIDELLAARADEQRRIGDLEAQLAQLRERLSADDRQDQEALAQARQRITELEDLLERRSSEASQASESLAHTQRELDRAASASTAADDAAAGLREANRGLTEQVQALTEQLATANDRATLAQGELGSRVQTLQQAVDDAQASAAERQQRLDALQTAHETLKARAQADAQAAGAALEQAQARVTELEQALAGDRSDQQTAAVELAKAGEQIDTLRAELERLREEHAQNDGQVSTRDEQLKQLRAEVQELGQQLEERGIALTAARAEQAELIEALNAASAERDTLQFALSEHDDEQARLVDLENQLAEAVRAHENELLQHEQAHSDLREQLDVETTRRHALQDEVQRLQQELADDADEELLAERDALRTQLIEREREVKQLRSVMEEYVDQIRSAQYGGQEEDVEALRTELEMVREQAIRDVARMREQLATAETQKRRLQEADGREAISLESMRQRIEELETTLGERQRDLTQAEESRQMVEDALEDKNREFEAQRLELDETLGRLHEAEAAHEQVQAALAQLRESAEQTKMVDLRDARIAASEPPADRQRSPRRGSAALIGAAVVLGALEALSFVTGNGELFSALLKLSGQ